MDAIDRDRTLLAAEAGYTAAFTTMDAVPHATSKDIGERESKNIGSGAGGEKLQETVRNQSGGHGSGLKNQLLIGWRPPIKRA